MFEESWEVLGSEPVIDHPFLKVRMQQVRLPDGRVIPDWPFVHTREYVNVFVLNEAGEALILEGYKHGLGRSSWQMVGGYLEEGEDPLLAAQREMREETGYASDDWRHLGSFVVDANRHVGTGHFYLARDARSVARPEHDDLEGFEIRWVSLEEVGRALRDGRVGIISYGVNIALALLALKA
ncbi:MAG TPA: NUDIX hydrolase [Chloroflexia bacterium]|jgi:ADP-ribose pyrophosphatase